MSQVDDKLENILDTTDENLASGVDYDDWNGVDMIESLCMNCGATGQTRLMLHKIPYFRELIIASFACEECGERNNEVTFGGEIQIQGCSYELKVTTPKDMDRQLIKSDSATVRIKELDFEIPPLTQKGEISTIEGILRTAAKNLALYQTERMDHSPEVGKKVADVIMRLTMMAGGFEEALPFHITVDDPAGNSYMENIHAPQMDPNMSSRHYFRTAEQDVSLGLQADKGVFRDDKESNFKALMGGAVFGAIKVAEDDAQTPPPLPTGEVDIPAVTVPTTADHISAAVAAVLAPPAPPPCEGDDEGSIRLGRSEVISIPSQCPNCQAMGESLTALTDIPHFKEVIIMAFDCKSCGFRNNEVKGGGAVPSLGTEVRLLVTGPDDLKRDLLKSDTSMVLVPELDLELSQGTLGGVFTTVEGLLTKIHKSLLENNPFSVGDSTTLHHSADPSVYDTKTRFTLFMAQLQELGAGKRFPFTLVLRDPLGNSFISAPLGSFLPPELDHNLTMINFERSFEENEDFGLNDINTADFETGVDHSVEILADRVTTVHVKGPDHPTLFAKGTVLHDDTQGGVFFRAAESESDVAEPSGDDVPYFNQPPAGWSVEKESSVSADGDSSGAESSRSTTNVRVFSDDSALHFVPYEEFSGARAGSVFRLGSKGLGYYQDVPPVIDTAENQQL